MPRGKKSSKKVPPWGRNKKDLDRELGFLDEVSADVPLGNTDPTMVRGVMYGGMPNRSRRATGRLRAQRGKNT